MEIVFTETLQCEILVIGNGAAGIRAALTAAKLGRDTVLLANRIPGEDGSSFYPLSPPWGIMYAEDTADALRFEEEIIAASNGCADPLLVQKLAEESLCVRKQLEAEGLPLRTHVSMGLTGCFGTQPRGAVLTALAPAVKAWRQSLAQATSLRQAIGWQAATLLSHNGTVCGITAVNRKGELMLVNAKAVILACGGAQGLYEHSFSKDSLVGAGYALAARHGARTVNLEFIQFINGALNPLYGLNYYQFTFVEQPQVLNDLGEAFLAQYLPKDCTVNECLSLRGHHGPFCVEDNSRFFDLAIVTEARKGHCKGAHIVPDPSRLVSDKYVHWREFLQSVGYSTATVMEIFPFCQAFNGGVRFQPDMTTDVPGLYVCGETAGGCHGSNRMGGNAILATQVFGRLSAQAADQYCNKLSAVPTITQSVAKLQLTEELTSTAPCIPAQEAKRAIQQIMQQYAFLQRDAQGLQLASQKLAAIHVDSLTALGTQDAQLTIQTRNGLDAAKLIVCAMLKRTESRGGHYRTDYPTRNPALTCPIDTGWHEISQTE